MGVAPQVIDEIAPADVHHRANRDEGTESHLCAQAPIKHGSTQGTALTDEANRAGSGHSTGKGRIEAGRWTHHTQTIVANDAQLPAAGLFQNMLLQLGAWRPGVLETGDP